MKEPSQYRLALSLPDELQFVIPYIAAELPEADITVNPVSVSGFEYATLLCTAEHRPDVQRFAADCEKAGAKWAALVCAPVIGTGMRGFGRELAEKVYSGRFIHCPATSVTLSVVHAVDVARAVRLTLGRGDEYTVSDGCETSLDDLADALAWRMNEKRVFTARSFWAKLVAPRATARRAADLPKVSCQKLADETGFTPTPVVEYLRTHDYEKD